ncbi:M14 family metallopeptidase [Candidatus Poribacteria bacterium]
MTEKTEIPELSFRAFLTYQGVTDFASSLAAAKPDLCRLSSLGESREGRGIPLLTITDYNSGAPEDKPGYLIYGNIHAVELSGTHAALYTARQLLIDHDDSGLLKNIVFYIIPRLNPDGAEFAVTTSGPIRSRTDRSQPEPNSLYPRDMNGDGLILSMRQEHPDGAFITDPDDPRLLIRRKADSKGPFYRVMPEGEVYQWDGSDHISVDDRGLDWNRNWSYDWSPEPEQAGAGDFPFSEPEMHHLAEFIYSRPNIFAALDYHTGPAGVLRPPSAGSNGDLDEGDLRVMEDLARIASKHTGFPIIPIIKYHWKRGRDKAYHGTSTTLYHQLGIFVTALELGVMMNSAGITTDQQFEVQNDEDREELMRKFMQWWDAQEERDPVYQPWEVFQHPQLGKVEIGGFLRRHAANPALCDLEKISEGTYKFTLEHARKHPQIVLEDVQADAIGGQVFRIRAHVANRGEFPTNVSNRGKALRRPRRIRVEFHTAEGVELLSDQGHYILGHLDGITGSRPLEWLVSVPEGRKELCEIRVFGGTGGNVKKILKTS